MDSVGQRINQLIIELGLKKVQFADRVQIDQSYVTQLVNGRRTPGHRLIADICREFNVSEEWLRTGKGEMFVQLPEDEQLENRIKHFLSNGNDTFRERLVSLLIRLPPEHWTLLEMYIKELLGGALQTRGEEERRDWRDKNPSEWDDEDEATAVEEFRRQWRDEKNRRTEDGPVGGASAG